MISQIRMVIGSFFLFLQTLFSFPKIDETIYYINETEITEDEDEPEINLDKTILSYNIHNGFNIKYNFQLNDIIDYIKRKNVSIICLQEISNIEQYNYIKHNCNYKYGFYDNHKCILSNFKIKENKIINFTNMNLYNPTSCIHSILEVNDTNLNIFNIHFTSDITGFKQLNEKEDLHKYIETNNIDDFILIGDTNSIELFERNDALIIYNKKLV